MAEEYSISHPKKEGKASLLEKKNSINSNNINNIKEIPSLTKKTSNELKERNEISSTTLQNKENQVERDSTFTKIKPRYSLVEKKVIRKEETINRLKMRIKNIKIDNESVEEKASLIQNTSKSTNENINKLISSDFNTQKSNLERRLNLRRQSKLINSKGETTTNSRSNLSTLSDRNSNNLMSITSEFNLDSEKIVDNSNFKHKSKSVVFDVISGREVEVNVKNTEIKDTGVVKEEEDKAAVPGTTKTNDCNSNSNITSKYSNFSTMFKSRNFKSKKLEESNTFNENKNKSVVSSKMYKTYEIKEENDLDEEEGHDYDSQNEKIKSRNSIQSLNRSSSQAEKVEQAKEMKANSHSNQKDKTGKTNNTNNTEKVELKVKSDKEKDSISNSGTNTTFSNKNINSLKLTSNQNTSTAINNLSLSEVERVENYYTNNTNNTQTNGTGEDFSETYISNNKTDEQNTTTTKKKNSYDKPKRKFNKASERIKDITQDFMKEYSDYFYSFIMKKFIKEILDKSHLNLISYTEMLKSNSIGIKEIESLLEDSKYKKCF